MLFDTHAHLDDSRFDEDREAVIASLPSKNVALYVNIGDSLESSKASVELADKYDFVYATVGFHPHIAKEVTDEMLLEIEKLAKHPKVVAIGEIGLDYHYDNSAREEQAIVFRKQMELAKKLNMPVVIHSREATQDTLEILKEFPEVTGIVHSYSGSTETAQLLIKMGYYLSFNGVATFKNAHKAREVLIHVPHDRVIIETDSPYLTPEPFRGRRNDPSLVQYVANLIAELWGLSVEEVEDITLNNGKKVYRIEAK